MVSVVARPGLDFDVGKPLLAHADTNFGIKGAMANLSFDRDLEFEVTSSRQNTAGISSAPNVTELLT
jgi:hypothetical protein